MGSKIRSGGTEEVHLSLGMGNKLSFLGDAVRRVPTAPGVFFEPRVAWVDYIGRLPYRDSPPSARRFAILSLVSTLQCMDIEGLDAQARWRSFKLLLYVQGRDRKRDIYL